MSKAKILSIFNQKGGCAKTMTSVSLASILGERGFKVLLVDADPSKGATTDLGISDSESKSYADLIIEYCDDSVGEKGDPIECVRETSFKGLYCLPATGQISRSVEAMNNYSYNKMAIFKTLFKPLENEFDFIIIDTIGNRHNPLSLTALCWSSHVIMPAPIENKALKGVGDGIPLINTIVERENPDLNFLGVVVVTVDERLKYDKLFLDAAKDNFGDSYIPYFIRRSVATAQKSAFEHIPVNYLPKKGNLINEDYQVLADWLLERLGEKN